MRKWWHKIKIEDEETCSMFFPSTWFGAFLNSPSTWTPPLFPSLSKEREGKRGGVHVLGLLFEQTVILNYIARGFGNTKNFSFRSYVLNHPEDKNRGLFLLVWGFQILTVRIVRRVLGHIWPPWLNWTTQLLSQPMYDKDEWTSLWWFVAWGTWI